MQQFRGRLASGINFNLLREIKVTCDGELASKGSISDAERVQLYVAAQVCAQVMVLLEANPETSFHTMIENELGPDLLNIVTSTTDSARIRSASSLIGAFARVTA
jgi:hypothetical protein